MLEIKIEKSFQKDIERDKKSGKYQSDDFEELKSIIKKLQCGDEIDTKYRRHFLRGDMSGLESMHVKSDWLLIFSIDEQYLSLAMSGKHTQVYRKFK